MPESTNPTTTTAGAPQETPSTTPTKGVDFSAETTFFLASAADIDPKDIRICRADTDLVASNVRRGVSSIAQEDVLARIRVELPTADLGPLLELDRLGEAVAFAARNVTAQPKSEELVTKTVRGRKVRKVLFSQIETFIGTGEIAREELAKMRKGNGIIDVANDLIDSVALLEKYEPVLGGRLSVTPEMLTEGQELGRWLRQTVEPSVSPKLDSGKKNEGTEVRDRLWTLLQRRHRELRHIGAWLWPEEVDKRVPPLLARQRKRKSKEKEEGPAGGTGGGSIGG